MMQNLKGILQINQIDSCFCFFVVKSKFTNFKNANRYRKFSRFQQHLLNFKQLTL